MDEYLEIMMLVMYLEMIYQPSVHISFLSIHPWTLFIVQTPNT
jgi:hypothetical protein